MNKRTKTTPSRTNWESDLESMLFNYETTYRTDYRDIQVGPPDKLERISKPTKDKKVVFEKLKDLQTLTPIQGVIPFSLHIKPKEIIRTSPYTTQDRYEKNADPHRLEAQRSRPRVYMTPALSLDDVEDPVARQLIVNDVYTSNYTRACKEVLVPENKVVAPLQPLPAPAKPIFLPELKPPKVPKEWQKDSVHWDKHQARYSSQPTKEFWKKHDLYAGCVSCKEAAKVKAMRRTGIF